MTSLVEALRALAGVGEHYGEQRHVMSLALAILIAALLLVMLASRAAGVGLADVLNAWQ